MPQPTTGVISDILSTRRKNKVLALLNKHSEEQTSTEEVVQESESPVADELENTNNLMNQLTLEEEKDTTITLKNKAIPTVIVPRIVRQAKTLQDILRLCDQESTMTMEEFYRQNESSGKPLKKLVDSTFSQVFQCADNVYKLISIEDIDKVYQEIIITKALRKLTKEKGAHFVNLKEVKIVKGKWYSAFINAWHSYMSVMEIDMPALISIDFASPDQLYAIMQMEYSGIELELWEPKEEDTVKSIIFQIASSLAIAEEAMEFEHRDLHWSNILISHTNEKSFTFKINQDFEVSYESHGVKATIIDYTLSRLKYQRAGISGLAAANALTEKYNCKNITILEARDRIGGRIHTNHDFPCEIGAGWIHGTNDAHPVVEITDKFYIDTVYVGGDSSYIGGQFEIEIFDEHGDAINPALKQKSFQLMEEFWKVQKQVLTMAKNNKRRRRHLSKARRPLKQYDEQVLKIVENDSLCEFFDFVIEHYFTEITKEELDLLFWHFEIIFGGDMGASTCELSLAAYGSHQMAFQGGDSVIVDGYDQVANALAADFLDRILLGKKVIGIDYCGDEVHVKTADGEVFVGSKVIITVPLGVLRKNVIKFNPSLPDWKRNSISKLKMGLLNRVAVKFENVSSFLDDEVYTFAFVSDVPGEWPIIVNANYVKKNRNVLEFMVGGNPAYVLEQVDEKVLIESILHTLKKILKKDIPEPIDWIISRWSRDEFSFGSYSAIPPGSSIEDVIALGKSVDGKLYFAGEATSVEFTGTVHGSIRSGRKAAFEIVHL